jgi:hypothetical protein
MKAKKIFSPQRDRDTVKDLIFFPFCLYSGFSLCLCASVVKAGL